MKAMCTMVVLHRPPTRRKMAVLQLLACVNFPTSVLCKVPQLFDLAEILKIERLQNVHLLRAYQAQKKNMSDKNVHCGGAGEKLLYHGTAKNNCIPIMKNGFNRSFAGCNGTSYGNGTYFAVNASLSVGYSSPAHDGSRSMFVVRVLTGVYDAGHKSMKVPPPRSYQQPHDLYDSVVDQIHQPDLYVVFQDNQAYPDYLITFR
uniref:Poly [ADP-ribose] polymerase n=1 Tax=Monopterus albus TaxID=43700 RepID=A0A3Q3K5R2_MONAL